MSMQEWAKKEIEMLVQGKEEIIQRMSGDYGVACYKGALEAFEVLCGQGHSGYSICFTKQILNRLIAGKPLTPIEDTEDVWNLVEHNEVRKSYQCKRMSSLFKDVYADGTIEYHDNDCCVCVDKNTGSTYSSGLVRSIYKEMYPITLPYMPSSIPDRIYCEDLLTDPKNGDFDTVGIFYIQKPNGEKVEVNRYFKEAGDGWEEIRIAEYEDRMDLDKVRKEALKNEV